MTPSGDTQEAEVSAWERICIHGPAVLLALLVGLALFTAVLEMRMRMFRNDLLIKQMQLEPLVSPALAISAQESDVGCLMQFKVRLNEWQKARVAWADWLNKVATLTPTNLTLRRINLRGTLGGSFTRKEPFLPARFVPARSFRIEIEGIGRDAETVDAVSRLASALSQASREANFPLQVEMQGVQMKPMDGATVREFSLLAVGPERAEP